MDNNVEYDILEYVEGAVRIFPLLLTVFLLLTINPVVNPIAYTSWVICIVLHYAVITRNS